jgi:hypothetical protein
MKKDFGRFNRYGQLFDAKRVDFQSSNKAFAQKNSGNSACSSDCIKRAYFLQKSATFPIRPEQYRYDSGV